MLISQIDMPANLAVEISCSYVDPRVREKRQENVKFAAFVRKDRSLCVLSVPAAPW